jgi:hypothetical protein
MQEASNRRREARGLTGGGVLRIGFTGATEPDSLTGAAPDCKGLVKTPRCGLPRKVDAAGIRSNGVPEAAVRRDREASTPRETSHE